MYKIQQYKFVNDSLTKGKKWTYESKSQFDNWWNKHQFYVKDYGYSISFIVAYEYKEGEWQNIRESHPQAHSDMLLEDYQNREEENV